MKMKHAYIAEIEKAAKEYEMLHDVNEMIAQLQYDINYDNSIFFEAVDTGEIFDNSDLARVRGVLEGLMNHRAWKIEEK